MLSQVKTMLRFAVRRTRSSLNAAAEEQKLQSAAQTIKFTDDELLDMGSKSPARKSSILKMFKKKYQEPSDAELKEGIPNAEAQPNGQQAADKEPNLESRVPKNRQNKFKHFVTRSSTRIARGGLFDLVRVRMGEQYLPDPYMKNVQKIFNKYDQKHLREIAWHFTNLVRLRYAENKIDFQANPDLKFSKIEGALPHDKKVQQIYLIGKEAVFQDKQRTSQAKVDQDPMEPELAYTQNVIVSYLLNRVPKTHAVALRVFSELKQRYPQLKPRSLIDFGSGLSSGSIAFSQVFGEGSLVMNVDPSARMRKLSKFLTNYTQYQYFESLGEMSSRVKDAEVVYAGYVLNEIRGDLVEVYLEALLAKLSGGGFLILVQHGNPFGSRLIHETRRWAIDKKVKVVAPCPHEHRCPLAKSKQWCHFDQPAGMYPRQVFGVLPNNNSVKLEKFCYLILQKPKEVTEQQEISPQPATSEDWDRVVYPLAKRGGHFIMTLCTRSGTFEKRVVAKSHGLEYKEGRKLKWGDLWRHGKRIPNKYRKQRKTGKRLW